MESHPDDTGNFVVHYRSRAVVTSGTATIETALFRCHRRASIDAGKYHYRMPLSRWEWVSLVNLIGNKAVISGAIQDDAAVTGVSEN